VNCFYCGVVKTHYKGFYPKHIDQYYYFNLFLESLLRKCLVMPRYSQNINSSGFKWTTGGGVKRFSQAFKTSTNCPRALISVVSRLHRALTSLRIGASIIKRLWIYSVASNYIKPVHTIYLTMSTYTFNYCHYIYGTVKGEIQRKALFTHFNNKLAPKFRSFSTNISQTSALVLVKIFNIVYTFLLQS